MTPADMKRILLSNDGAVGRAMVMLLAEQTIDERRTQDVKVRNDRGFAVSTKDKGSYCARWVLGVPRNISDENLSKAIGHFLARRGETGRPLTGKWIGVARDIALFHHRQLSEIANEMTARAAVTF
jgi:hypothetical protein